MDRGSSSAFQTEVVKASNRPIHLVDIVLDSATSYVTDHYKTVTYDSNDYTGIGHFLGFSDIEENSEVIVSSITLQLSGVDQTWISTLLSETYIDRVVKIYTAFIDDSAALIASPVLIFEGRMDSPTITENPDSGECTVSIGVTNAWVDFMRGTGRHTNHEEQQVFFSGDKGFEYASEIVKDITWGSK